MLEEWGGEDICLSPEDSLKKKRMPTSILVWSMATLGKTCILTPDSLVPPDPTLQKESFYAIPSSLDHTAIPRHSQECHFVLSTLPPALERHVPIRTVPGNLASPPTLFPGIVGYVTRCIPSLPWGAGLSFCQATCVLLETKRRWCPIIVKRHICLTLGAISAPRNR